MLTYAISNIAYMAIINELLTIGSSVVGNIRHDFKKKKDNSASENISSDSEDTTEVI